MACFTKEGGSFCNQGGIQFWKCSEGYSVKIILMCNECEAATHLSRDSPEMMRFISLHCHPDAGGIFKAMLGEQDPSCVGMTMRIVPL